MLPDLSPEKLNRLLRQLGITAEPIEATQVIIKTPSGDVIIDEPKVIKTKMKDQIIFQISGKVNEEPFSQEDIKLVMEESGVKDVELVKKALRETKGDIVEAIVKLKEAQK